MFSDILRRLSRFQKIKIAIILVYFFLNAFLLILAFQMNIDDLKFLVRMARYIPYFRYIASANMLLIITVIAMNYLELKKLSNMHKSAQEEVKHIKSKLNDMEEEKRELLRRRSKKGQS
jgi:hypothetical protein